MLNEGLRNADLKLVETLIKKDFDVFYHNSENSLRISCGECCIDVKD